MKRFGHVAAALGLAVMVAGCSTIEAWTGGSSDDPNYTALGTEALKTGDYDAAEAYLRRALQADPRDEYALLSLGAVYQDTGRAKLAHATYAELIRVHEAARAAVRPAGPEAGPSAAEALNELAPASGTDEAAPPARHTAATDNAPAAAVTADASGATRQAAFDEEAPIPPASLTVLRGHMTRMYANLTAMANAMRQMSESLHTVAETVPTEASRAGQAPDQHALANRPLGATGESMVVTLEPTASERPPARAPGQTRRDPPAVQTSAAESESDEVAAISPSAQTEARAIPVAARAAPAEPALVGEEVQIHLGSYRNVEHAERGWNIIRDDNSDLLSNLSLHVRRIDFGPDLGVYYRLQAGPVVNEPAALDLCDSLMERDQYCAVAYF